MLQQGTTMGSSPRWQRSASRRGWPLSAAARGITSAWSLLTLAFLLVAVTVNAEEARYSVNPGDVLQVFVWNQEKLSGELLVAPDGTLSFPMVGVVDVKGLSTGQISERLAKGLSDYLRDEPVVTVALLKVEGNKVYVHGLVLKPGAYVVNSAVDVVQALALAGGLQTFAKEQEIKVMRRQSDGAIQSFPFDYEKFKNGKGLDSNMLLQSGDLVVVP